MGIGWNCRLIYEWNLCGRPSRRRLFNSGTSGSFADAFVIVLGQSLRDGLCGGEPFGSPILGQLLIPYPPGRSYPYPSKKVQKELGVLE
jgi:hypothetical protein